MPFNPNVPQNGDDLDATVVRNQFNSLKTVMRMFLIYLLLGSAIFAADVARVQPEQVLKEDGILVISDGSSVYAFKADGSFSSSPLKGFRGRCLKGTWTPNYNDMTVVTVKAKVNWVNSLSTADDYRKIVFFLSSGKRRLSLKDEWCGIDPPIKPISIFDCYFLIDEMVKIPKPDK